MQLYILNITLLTNYLSPNGGGLYDVIRRLSQEFFRNYNVTVQVIGSVDDLYTLTRDEWAPIQPVALPVFSSPQFAISLTSFKWLKRFSPDIIHLHGLWTFQSFVSYRWSKANNTPIIISPHGMLNPGSLGFSSLKKQIVSSLLEKRVLNQAACIHALNDSEAADIREYNLRNPICIIPNGVDIPSEKTEKQMEWIHDFSRGRKVMLYLGRIHPIKGIDQLIIAWRKFYDAAPSIASDWCLLICGWSQLSYEEELNQLVRDLSLQDCVHFAGPQYNIDKQATYENVDCFILPSKSEGAPLVILEAWANKLPVMMTEACNYPDGFTENAAIKIMPNCEDIAKNLIDFLRNDSGLLQTLGENGFRLVQQHYQWQIVAQKFMITYEWLTGTGNKPDFVLTYK